MAWAALVLPLVAAPALDFETPATTLATALERLSEVSGTRLAASPAARDEIVFIHVRGTTLPELKARLAEALDGAWVRSGEIETFVRRPEHERAIWNRHLALRRSYLDEELERVRKTLEEPFEAGALARGLMALPSGRERQGPGGRQIYERERALFAASPAARLLNRVLLACDPDDLAAVGSYERALFTDNPTRLQKRIDRTKLERALAQFRKEQEAWSEEASRHRFPANDSRMVGDPISQASYDPGMTGIALEVRRGDSAALFNVNLIRYPHGAGQPVLAQASLAHPSRRFLESMVEYAEDAADVDVPLSPHAKLLVERMKRAVGGEAVPEMTEEELSFLIDPVAHEPLAALPGDVLAEFARRRDLDVVASLPDMSFATAAFPALQGGALKLNAAVKALGSDGQTTLLERDGWAIIKPLDRVESRQMFTPRAPLRTFLSQVHAKGRVDVLDHARYAFLTGRRGRNALGEWHLMMLAPEMMSALDTTDWNTLRLYGSLSNEQRRSVEAGGRIPLDRLTPAQRSVADAILLLEPLRSEKWTDARSMMWGTQSPVEPTVALANGTPPAAALVGRTAQTTTIVAYGRGKDGRPRPLRPVDPWTIANLFIDGVPPPQSLQQYGMPGYTGFAMGGERLLALRLELSPGVWRESVIVSPVWDEQARPVAWDQLPEATAKEIRGAIDQLRLRRNQPGRVIPP
jgi:hypothetical protein